VKVEQDWLSANDTQRIAVVVGARMAAGWTLHSVTFGTRYWTHPGAGQLTHHEDGWLLLFTRHET
jgi:hypothetical protein